MTEMTMRERMLAFMQGREHDRVPFVQYSGSAAVPYQEVWARLGRENIGILQWIPVYRFETPHCRFETEDVAPDGKKGFRRTLIAPEGQLWEERLYEPTFGTSAAASHFVKQPEDYRVLMSYFRDVAVYKDLAVLHDKLSELGDDGLPHTCVTRTPFQQLWIEWVGIEDLSIHMVECEGLMEEVFALMWDLQRRVFEVTCQAAAEAPIPYVVIGDNVTAPMIGESWFRKYCAASYDQLAEMLDEAGLDIPVAVHMDGDLRPLWDAIGESRVRALDSMSPPPDNDTSVADARAHWPDMRLMVNFPSSVHLATPDAVYARAMTILQQGGRAGRLQIQISENVPPGAWEKSYPAIARAIADFGPACDNR